MTLPSPRSGLRPTPGPTPPALNTPFAVVYLIIERGTDRGGEGGGLRVVGQTSRPPLGVPRGAVVIRQVIAIPESAFGPLRAELVIAEPAVTTLEVRGDLL